MAIWYVLHMWAVVGVDEHDNICPNDLSLHEIRSHVWQGVVFVNVSGEAPAFEQAHKELIDRWAEFDQPYYLGGAASRFDMTLDTNWKTGGRELLRILSSSLGPPGA